MLDENLPTFYLKPSSDGVKHNASILLSHHGSDAAPAYFLRHPDPALSASKNRYAVALYDSYNPEILFGEVLLIPQWTQPTLSQEEIRRNGGVAPPQPILPTEFTIQLYNPDQQVVVRWYPGSWNSALYWEFEMPQQSFRQPSASALDRTQSDPTASETTPKITFKWRKDGKFAKDYVCSLAGRSTNLDGSKRKHREPDITIALFQQLREITLYEPNFYRVDMEDPKGLEVVLLLGAVIIREVFHGQLKDIFNIDELPRRNSNVTSSRKNSANNNTSTAVNAPAKHHLANTPKTNIQYPHPSPSVPGQRNPLQKEALDPRPPPTDPRSQWALDAETARLKKQVEHEERERRRAENAETKRLKKMLETEERERQRKQAEVDKETERLKKLYAAEQRQIRSKFPQQHSAPILQTPFSRPQSSEPWLLPQPQRSSRPYLQTPGNAPSSGGFSGSSAMPNGKKIKPKKSFFGIRSVSDNQPQRLQKKQSSVW